MILLDNVAVKIRDKKITEIITWNEYVYDSVPIINGRGFEVKVSSQKDFDDFINEYKNTNGSEEFFGKWMRFETYRNIVLHK